MELHQVLAIESDVKNKTHRTVSDLHKLSKRQELYEGRLRQYEPFTVSEDGSVRPEDQLPDEMQNIQLNAGSVLSQLTETLENLWNLTATKDWTNSNGARADIVLENGTILMEDVPVTYLLFLEKQIKDVEKFIEEIPVLRAGEKWTWDDEEGCYVSESKWTSRTKKVPRNHVLVHATDKHPAQVQVYHEDVAVGRFNTTMFSSALPMAEKQKLMKKANSVKKAIVQAREAANSVTADKKNVATKVFDYILNG